MSLLSLGRNDLGVEKKHKFSSTAEFNFARAICEGLVKARTFKLTKQTSYCFRTRSVIDPSEIRTPV